MNCNMPRAGIMGMGRSVPENVLTNEDLEEMVDTSDEWIRSRSGIVERRIADEDTSTSDLSYSAAVDALEDANVAPNDVDLIIVATVTPDMNFPATSCMLQDRLGMEGTPAFDLHVGCTGFIYALTTAEQFVKSGTYDVVLVIATDLLSRITDWQDRSTCVLFGDAAGAAVVGRCSNNGGILATYLGTDGSGADHLKMPGGGSLHPASEETVRKRMHYLKMNGREVFKFAVNAMGNSAKEVVERAGLSFSDIDWYIPHQANIRIIDSSAKRLGIPRDRVYVNIDRYGNTSGASVPVALSEAIEKGYIKRGDTVLAVAFGAGLSWASAVMKMTGESGNLD